METQEDVEILRSSNRLRELLVKASPGLAKVRTEAHSTQLPQLVKIVELLQRQQASERQGHIEAPDPPARANIAETRVSPNRLDVGTTDVNALLYKLSPFDFRDVQQRLLSRYCEVSE